LPSIRALTESSLLWTGYQTIERATMATLKVPITQRDHMRGPANAAVTLVEYGDYECPHCGLAHPIVDMVQKHFAKHLNFVFRHFPLSQIHLNAEPAAESAEFAGAHDRFWEMHDEIFENQERLGLPLLFALAERLDLIRFTQCFTEQRICPQSPSRLSRRRTQWSERHTDGLHQWTAT
jgi:hypothetical protein